MPLTIKTHQEFATDLPYSLVFHNAHTFDYMIIKFNDPGFTPFNGVRLNTQETKELIRFLESTLEKQTEGE